MVIHGRVQNGVVVLQNEASLPEGTKVTVVVRPQSELAGEEMTDDERRRLREALRRFEALPDEYPGDGFSGADHDRVLYGDD